MPRIVVTRDSVGAELRRPYMMDEQVDPVDLEDEHASLALIQRLAWAIEASKQAETTGEPCPAAVHGDRGPGAARTPESHEDTAPRWRRPRRAAARTRAPRRIRTRALRANP